MSAGQIKVGTAPSSPTPEKPPPKAAAAPSTSKEQQQQGIDLQPIRGTRDFFPEDLRLRSWLFDHFRAAAIRAGFEEVDFPIVESASLYTRKAGEEITEQLYAFEDKGGRAVSLRPELTPSLARLVLRRGRALALPAKWFSVGQCWRYERTTRGRRREHYQWNMDVVGVPGVEAEAELMACMVDLLSSLGLTHDDVILRYSNRNLLQEALGAILRGSTTPAAAEGDGVDPALFARVCVCVDKIDKIGEEACVDAVAALPGLDGAMAAQVVELVARGTIASYRSLLSSPQGGDGEQSKALGEVERLEALLEGRGLGAWTRFDPSVVRGLAYYSGTVFECFDARGELRAVAGGGRYDGLLAQLAGAGVGRGGAGDHPMVGFGFGDAVIVELLKERGLMPDLEARQRVEDVVCILPTKAGKGAGEGEGGAGAESQGASEADLHARAGKVAGILRAKGRRVDVVLELRKLKWVFKHADRCGASRLVMVGAEEWAQGTVRVKDLAEREETVVPIDAL